MFSGGAGDLQVVDASNPTSPVLAGTWTPPMGTLHSIALNDDGSQAYLSLWRGGLLVADASQFTAGRPNPQLSLLTSRADALPAPAGGNVHSAVPVPGRNLLIVTDERYQPTPTCGPARLVDISDPAHPRQVSVMTSPEDDRSPCPSSPSGTWTSHNPTPVGDLAFITWYSSGLQVFDISNASAPVRLTEFRPQAVEPGARDPQLGATPTMTWSYPIVRDGLIYVADINQGLYVLRYQGPHQEQVEQVGLAEGNSNQFRPGIVATPTPSATPAPQPSARSTVSPSARSAATTPASPLALLTGRGGVLLGAAVLIVLAVAGAVVYMLLKHRSAQVR
jgi:hypothetical protein